MRNSITIVVPALNEEEGIAPTIENLLNILPGYFRKFKIVIYNDGSSDDTGKIAQNLADTHECVQVVHHKRPKNIGFIYNNCFKNCSTDYYMMIHGQNDITSNSLAKVFNSTSSIVIPYQMNTNERQWYRILLSKKFVQVLNLLSGHQLNYYNHYVLVESKLLRNIEINTSSYAFQAEVLIKLLNQGHSYEEIGIIDDFSNKRKTNAFKIRNILGVIHFIFNLATGRIK
ncbi:MAG: glycosyltransferase [Oligoflexia bacterium]|nr:glycosyltransferase [Oligoflexia bacterium]